MAPLLLALGSIAAIVAFFWGMYKIYDNRENRKIEALAGPLGGLGRDGTLSFECAAGEARVYKKFRPKVTYLVLALKRPLGFKASLAREVGVLKYQKNHGYQKEIQILDRSFDDKYLIQTASPEPATGFLRNKANQEIIDYFFSQGFSYLDIMEDEITLWLCPYARLLNNPELIRSYVEQLGRLVIE